MGRDEGLPWAGSPGVDVVIPFPECYLNVQATKSGIRWLMRAVSLWPQGSLQRPARKGLIFQAGFWAAQVGTEKLDFCARVYHAKVVSAYVLVIYLLTGWRSSHGDIRDISTLSGKSYVQVLRFSPNRGLRADTGQLLESASPPCSFEFVFSQEIEPKSR